MKKSTLFAGIAFCAVVLLSLAWTPSITPTEPTPIAVRDVVYDPPPVAESEWQKELVTKLQIAGSDVLRQAIMDSREGRQMKYYLAFFVRDVDYNCEIVDVEWLYASGSADKVNSGDGNMYSGGFSDQLVARFKFESECKSDNVELFARCTNQSFFEIHSTAKVVLGSGGEDLAFRIEPGNALNDYLDPKTLIGFARMFGLPIYHGKVQVDFKTADMMRTTSDKLAAELSVGGLTAGDLIDFRNMTINGISVNSAGNYRA